MSKKKSGWTGLAAALVLACVVAGCLFGFSKVMNKVPVPAVQMPPLQRVDTRPAQPNRSHSGGSGGSAPGSPVPAPVPAPVRRPPGDTGAGGPAGPNGPGGPIRG
jgi:hypothetical protein